MKDNKSWIENSIKVSEEQLRNNRRQTRGEDLGKTDKSKRLKIAIGLAGVAIYAAIIGGVGAACSWYKKQKENDAIVSGYQDDIGKTMEITTDIPTEGIREYIYLEGKDGIVFYNENNIERLFGISKEQYEILINYYKDPNSASNEEISGILESISEYQTQYVRGEITRGNEDVISYMRDTLSTDKLPETVVDHVYWNSDIDTRRETREYIIDELSDIALYEEPSGDEYFIRVVPEWIGEVSMPKFCQALDYLTPETFEEITGTGWDLYCKYQEVYADYVVTIDESAEIAEMVNQKRNQEDSGR